MTDRAVIDQVDAVLVGSAKLPRDNGELVFEEPWQGRALGMGVVAMERFDITREEFRDALIVAIAAHPADPDETVATACAEKGLARSRAFRWDETAHRVFEAYQHAIERRRSA